MKKIFIVSLVFILLAVSVVPVMAGEGSSNGHGNGVGAGQGNGGGNQNKDKEHGRSNDKGKNKDQVNGKFKNQENNKWKLTPFYIQGVITALGADTITVNVLHANAKAKNFIGGTMVISTNESTLLHVVNQGEDNEGGENEGVENEGSNEGSSDEGNRAWVPIDFSLLAVGQSVAVHGRLTGTDPNTAVYMARMVTVFVGAPENQPSEP